MKYTACPTVGTQSSTSLLDSGRRPGWLFLTSFRLSEGRIIFTNFFRCAKMRSCSVAEEKQTKTCDFYAIKTLTDYQNILDQPHLRTNIKQTVFITPHQCRSLRKHKLTIERREQRLGHLQSNHSPSLINWCKRDNKGGTYMGWKLGTAVDTMVVAWHWSPQNSSRVIWFPTSVMAQAGSYGLSVTGQAGVLQWV